MAEEIQVTIAMERFRCQRCHRYFLVELGSPHPCPACASADAEVMRMKLRVAQDERDEAFKVHRRQVSALKGAITKAKKR